MNMLNVVTHRYNEIEIPFLVDNKSNTKFPCHENVIRNNKIISFLCKRKDVLISYVDEDHDFEDIIKSVHNIDYIDFLKTESSRIGLDQYVLYHNYVPSYVGNDTPIIHNTYRQACASALTAYTAAQIINKGGEYAYALCRPPGHHAGKKFMGGYCYLNNAVIAANVFLQAGYGKAGILDLDYHFGNGTYDLIKENDNILFSSVHASTLREYPYYKFEEKMNCFFFEFNEKPKEQEYLNSVTKALEKLLLCDVLIVSVGFDILDKDPHGTWDLKDSIFLSIGEKLGMCGLPICFVQEGGYSIKNMQKGITSLLNGLLKERNDNDGLAWCKEKSN